jgi:alpha-L-rhamnosidase
LAKWADTANERRISMNRWIPPAAAGLACLLAAALPVAAFPADPAHLRIARLRAEYRVNPLGIDAERPRLEWLLEADRRAEVQAAYQVLVASSEDRLARDEGDLWDSGKVVSDRTAQVEYAGKPLAPRTRCSWKVRVWDRDGNASAWSAPALWTMGIPRSEWKARPIGCDIPRDAAPDRSYLPAPFLRKPFTAKAGLRRATVRATAAGVFELWVNGKRVGEDLFAPGWTEYGKRLYSFTYDVTDLLREGPNVLGAILGDGWYGLHHKGRGNLRLFAQLELEGADGSLEIIPTDTTWKATFRGPVLMSDIYQGESYDARREMARWSEPGFDDSSWAPASEGTKAPEGTWADVTEKVRKAVKDGAVSIAASNANFGDPIYGTAKSLKVEYAIGGVKATKTVPENGKLEIGAPAGKALEILKALYGAESVAADVTAAEIEGYPGVPVRRAATVVTSAEPREAKPGVWVFDLKQNFTGWARLKVRGEAGTKVTLRFAEMLNPDGTIYTTNLRGAKCTDTYVLRGGGEEVWEPLFTFHGFRYVELTGYPGKPPADAVTGVVLCSDAPLASTFECSNPMLNQLQHNIVWGQRSNYLEVPTDCPQRDERLGWTGDAQAFIGTGLYNQDLAAFFTSWLVTLNDSQRADGGYTDVSPRGGGVSAGWSDAGIVCPWTLWKVYGDTRVIERHFAGMERWIEHCRANSKDLLRPADGYGDWLNIGAELPKDVIATAWFAYSTRLFAEMARTIGKTESAAKAEDLLGKIRAAFQKAYVTPDGRVKGDTQTAYLMALAYDLLPAEKRAAAAARLIAKIEERKWHLSTGFLGVNLLLPTLTSIDRLDVAYRLLQNETFPSWGYPVKHGATTIWERWDGWTEDKGFQDPGMNSFNHYAYGSCGQWMFASLAGIDAEEPGFGRIRIRPRVLGWPKKDPGVGKPIEWVKASYDSIRGRIATSWEDRGDTLVLKVAVPANASASVWVPALSADAVTESGKPLGEADGVKFLRMEEGAAVLRVGSGEYEFVSKR